MIKKIAVLTSGGDAPGMNTAVSFVIKAAIKNNMVPYIIRDGYFGMYNDWIEKTNLSFADSIASYGGTAIGSARMPEFKELSVRKIAIKNLKKHGIESVIVIGGDGSYQGALKLTQMGINCIGLPGTIDNDIASSDFTIGFDTCLNTIVRSIDNIRDTMTSHNRCGIVEVMGRHCGDLAIYAAEATGAEVLSIPNKILTEKQIVEEVKKMYIAKKRSVIVLVTELLYDIKKLEKLIETGSKYVTKSTSLAHIQRGGRPSAMDRNLAYRCAIRAVEELLKNNGGLCIGIKNNEIVAIEIEKALKLKRIDRSKEIKALNQIQNVYSKIK